MRKLDSPSISRANCMVVSFNQIRMKDRRGMFGRPETTTGATPLKFYRRSLLDIRRIGAIRIVKKVVGTRPVWKVVKKQGSPPPFKQVEFAFMVWQRDLGKPGVDSTLGVKGGVSRNPGSGIPMGRYERIGQGREERQDLSESNTRSRDEIEAKIRAAT